MCVWLYLVSEQDFNSESSSSRRHVFDSERIVGVGDDVKVHVSLFVTDHIGITLNAHADITWMDGRTHNVKLHKAEMQSWSKKESSDFSVTTISLKERKI